jgi:SAM-dependent methyltransferase
VGFLRRVVKTLKKIPIDLGQYEMRYTTKGKLIGWNFVGDGAGKTALDLGCRDGYWSEKLAARGYQVTAVDLMPKYEKALTVNADLPLPFPDNSFDLVWSSEVIEHLKDPAFTVAEINRVLKPGGTLIMTTPNQGCWIFQLLERIGIAPGMIENEEHQHFFTYDSMRELLPGCATFGYFPYVLWRGTIQRWSGALSPTIVAVYANRKPAPTAKPDHESHYQKSTR